MEVRAGETYGRQKANGRWAMYAVLTACGDSIILRSLEPHAVPFETTAQKLEQGGYHLVSQTPFVSDPARISRRHGGRKLRRCPYTFDFIEGRADVERPLPV